MLHLAHKNQLSGCNFNPLFVKNLPCHLPMIQGFEGLIIFRLFTCNDQLSQVFTLLTFYEWIRLLNHHQLFKTLFLMIQRSFLKNI
jgi:hypothetical protein